MTIVASESPISGDQTPLSFEPRNDERFENAKYYVDHAVHDGDGAPAGSAVHYAAQRCK
jgi:hypothetical protein